MSRPHGLLFCLQLFSIVLNASNIILPANISKPGPAVGLIYLNGADISPSQYVPLCEAIQATFPQPLYVGLPAFIGNMPTVTEFIQILPILFAKMENEGLPKNSSIFMAGHSLGGAVLQSFSGIYQHNYTSIYPDWIYRGQMLNAAFVTREWRDNATQLIVNYTVPTLTLGGELDGCVRISRVIEQFYIQLIKNKTNGHDPFVNNKTLLDMAVILIGGMSHMQYAFGDIPSHVMDTDLIPEITYTQSHNIVSQYMSCWMSLELSNNECDFDLIYDAVYQSQWLANPFIAALQLEGSYWFEAPCNCDPLICETTAFCQGGAPWLDDVIYDANKEWIPQEIMCGFGKKGNMSIAVKQENTDSFHPTYQVNPVHYANIWNECTSVHDTNCTLNTSTVTQNIYPSNSRNEFGYSVDSGGQSTSAIEMRHKMKSRQACYEHVNGGNVNEDWEICGKINQHSIDWAMGHLSVSSQTLTRYEEYGEAIAIGSDIESETGTNWTYSPLSEIRKCNETNHRYYTSIQSNYLYLKTVKNGCKFKPASECGVHYCKILSPAHVMEWLYTDGLRFNLSLYNQNKTVNTTCG